MITPALMATYTDSHLCHFCVLVLSFLLIVGHASLLPCMLGNFCLNVRHCEFRLLVCWVFLCPCRSS